MNRMPPPTQPAPPAKPPSAPRPPVEPEETPEPHSWVVPVADVPGVPEASREVPKVPTWPDSTAHERLLNNLIAQPRAAAASLDSTDSLRRSIQARRELAEQTTRTYARDGSTTSLHVALPGDQGGSHEGRLRVLIIDDDLMRVAALQGGLNGAITAAACNAPTARHLLVLEAWDVVFLDLCQGGEAGNGLHIARFVAERQPGHLGSTMFVVHSLDACGPQMATLLRDGGFRVVQRTYAWQEIPLLRRLVREKRWPRQERRSRDGFDPALVLALPGY